MMSIPGLHELLCVLHTVCMQVAVTRKQNPTSGC
jgi:hypothetical protein